MSFRLVDTGWGPELLSALHRDRSELRIVCPFIKKRALARLLEIRPERIRVITRFNLDDFARGVSDIDALQTLLDHGAAIRGIRNLHAKLYVFGRSRAIVTSANLTEAGLGINPEFGIVTEDPTAIEECHHYFDALWSRGGDDLRPEQVAEWDATLTRFLATGARAAGSTALGDFGTDAGLAERSRIASPGPFSEPGQAFVKFLGERGDRVPTSFPTLKEIERAGCHWALAYGRRPRIVRDGALMYIARLTDEPDIRVFGRAIGMRHVPGRDDATPADTAHREWKGRWRHYIRVHHAEFLDSSMANGVSLNALMDALGADSFAATQKGAARGAGNTNPRRAYLRQPAVRLSQVGSMWIGERLQAAFDALGAVPRSALDKLDWPRPLPGVALD